MSGELDKLLLKSIKDQQKRIKPGECQKHVRLVLDPRCLSEDSGSLGLGLALTTELDKVDLKYVVRRLTQKNCIVWERSVGQRSLVVGAASAAAALDDEWRMENQVVRLLNAYELKHAIAQHSLLDIGDSLHRDFPGMKHTVFTLRDRKSKSTSTTTTHALIQLQVVKQVSVLEPPVGIPGLVGQLHRYTKAIAEAPFKRQKAEIMNGFKKFLANDKKQCVRVVGTNGFGRLWQQHLNRLPLVTLDIAETIKAQHSCPKRLLAALDREPKSAALDAIADLRINRGAVQPLQTDRRIGMALASKLHTLYTNRDPNALI